MSKIVITGASSEIGIAIANEISKPGDFMLLQCSSNRENLENASGAFPCMCEIVQADFRNRDSLINFIEKIKDTDILINGAAITKNDLLPHQDENHIDAMIDVNIRAAIKICQAVIPSMVSKRKGVIINISSVTASRADRGQAVYAGTKGFLESFTRAIAAEYGKKNIRANCVAPGPINSGSLMETLSYAEEEVNKSVALERLGTALDVSSSVKFLCSDEASFITGEVLHVNGGFRRGV